MKEVDLNPDDPKSAECIKQLEQVSTILLLIGYNLKISLYIVNYKTHGEKYIYLIYIYVFYFVLGNKSSPTVEAPKYCSILRQ